MELNGENGAVLNSNGGNISIGSLTSGQAMELTANGKNTFGFFFRKYVDEWGSVSSLPLGKATLISDVNVNLKNGAIGFYYEGTGISDTADIPSYLTGIIDTSGNTLTIKPDSDSYNIAINNTKLSLSSLADMSTSDINFTGSGKSKIYKSKLIVDIDSNLDKNNTAGNKLYLNTETGKSGIDINDGITVTGTEDGQAGIAQSFAYDDDKIDSNNFGNIILSGKNTVGMYTKMAAGKNDGIINVAGISGIGMYAATGRLENSGDIYRR